MTKSSPVGWHHSVMVYTKDLGHAQRKLGELVILLGVCLEYSICSLL